MAIKKYSTLAEAAEWLGTELKRPVPEAELWPQGNQNDIRFSAGIPGWKAPGKGELDWFNPATDEQIHHMVSDGYVRLTQLAIDRLQSGGSCSHELSVLPIANGGRLIPSSNTKQEIQVADIRIHRDELMRYAAANASNNANTAPAQTATTEAGGDATRMATANQPNKKPKTLVFEKAVMDQMTNVWNQWKVNQASDSKLTEPTKGEMHNQVLNALNAASIMSANKYPTLQMVCDKAKKWKKPAPMPVPVSPSVAMQKRHAFKGER